MRCLFKFVSFPASRYVDAMSIGGFIIVRHMMGAGRADDTALSACPAEDMLATRPWYGNIRRRMISSRPRFSLLDDEY